MQSQKEQFTEELNKPNVNTGSIDYNALIYGNRDSLVLLLLYIILLTPQINNLMNKVPYLSDDGNYPNYLGILIRGLLFVGIYVGMKNMKLI